MAASPAAYPLWLEGRLELEHDGRSLTVDAAGGRIIVSTDGVRTAWTVMHTEAAEYLRLLASHAPAVGVDIEVHSRGRCIARAASSERTLLGRGWHVRPLELLKALLRR